MKKICPTCRSEFEPTGRHQIYCSYKCRRRDYYRNNRDKIIEKSKAYQKKNKKQRLNYQKEYYSQNREKMRRYAKEHYKRSNGVTRVCVVCGKEFKTVYSQQVCCSPTCSSLRYKMKSKEWYAKNKDQVLERQKRAKKPKAPCNGLKESVPIEMCLNCELDDCKHE